ncbi:hypothetical protein C1X69_08630 [Pseudomonas sp. FW305-67]|nr:hypothetical protein C1X70_29880 [Pseudomonas sp. FW305-53]PMY88258.1 hypothetical protein C1X68_05605 [Pseudomonas sp. FW303-C2]PMY91574.1 hypothetical protein C1X67_17425 [Pseudomonas sp. FW305-62]PNA40861.1 hypothetical protein C1X71_21035 [Pseudomonas sp. FW306-2-2C-A10BC]PNA87623.1 hypothetical protein C1X66_08705 [Pseudomonas sp. MPR-R3B]PNB22293.1 hypothetical protein C1X69_08630 [Pseudomonas sp. FW305-67]
MRAEIGPPFSSIRESSFLVMMVSLARAILKQWRTSSPKDGINSIHLLHLQKYTLTFKIGRYDISMRLSQMTT